MYWLTSNDIKYQLFRNFIFGGLIIASVSYMATFLNPILAAIWWSYPISIIPVIYFMKNNGISNLLISKFLLGITVVTSLTVISCYLLSYYLKKNKDEFLKPIIKATLAWVVTSILFYLMVEYSGYSSYFI